MSNYIPHYTKKKQILARKELTLRRRIDRQDGLQAVLDAAEEVRAARVRALQAQRSTIAPTGDAETRYQRIDEQIKRLMHATLDSILAEFRFYVADQDDSQTRSES